MLQPWCVLIELAVAPNASCAGLSQKFLEAAAAMHRSFHHVALTTRSLLMLPEELCFQAQAVMLAKSSPSASAAAGSAQDSVQHDDSKPGSLSQGPEASLDSTHGPGKQGHPPQTASSSQSVAALAALNLMPRSRPVDSHSCSDTALLALMDLVRELLSEESAR